MMWKDVSWKQVGIKSFRGYINATKERRETRWTFYDKIDQGDKTTSLYALNNRAPKQHQKKWKQKS